MAPITTASTEETHGALLDALDMHKIHKPFRNPNWRPPQRRNKNLKQILSEAHRAQQSIINTQQNSGASTPVVPADGSVAPTLNPNPAQGSNDLSRLVLEKNARGTNGTVDAVTSTPGGGGGGGGARSVTNGALGVISVTYSGIAAPPSLKPKRKYCDITGLPARYTDPKTGLHFYNAEISQVIKSLTTSQVQEYLATRGANTILK